MKQFLFIIATVLGLAVLCTPLVAQDSSGDEEDLQASPTVSGPGILAALFHITPAVTQSKKFTLNVNIVTCLYKTKIRISSLIIAAVKDYRIGDFR